MTVKYNLHGSKFFTIACYFYPTIQENDLKLVIGTFLLNLKWTEL